MSSISSLHSSNKASLPTTSATMRAPWTGGLLQIALQLQLVAIKISIHGIKLEQIYHNHEKNQLLEKKDYECS
jgi:hypothetical protein